MSERTKYILDEADLPTQWYNIIPDLQSDIFSEPYALSFPARLRAALRGGSFPRRSFARSSLLAPQSSRCRRPFGSRGSPIRLRAKFVSRLAS